MTAKTNITQLFKKNMCKADKDSLIGTDWQQLETAFEALDARRKTDLVVLSRGQKAFTLKTDRTIIALKTSERPFLIDSITAFLADEKRMIDRLLYTQLKDGSAAVYISVNGSTPKAECTRLQKELISILHDVILATTDWQTMLERLRDTQAMVKGTPAGHKDDFAPLKEYTDFLSYLGDGNFTMLGYREYNLKKTGNKTTSSVRKGRGLGLLSDERGPVFINESKQGLTPDLQKLRLSGPRIAVVKVNRKATVHRRVPLDAIFVKELDKKGNITGERLFIGLFTSVTYSRSVSDVPLIRHKIAQVTKATKFIDNSHEYRALAHILEKYPRDELFQLEVEQLKDFALNILKLQERPQVGLFTRIDPFRRYISCLTYIPRERYSTAYRVKMAEILSKGFDGEAETFNTTLDDSPLGRVLFTIRVKQKAKATYDVAAIEKQLIEAAYTWPERLDAALHNEGIDDDEANDITHNYGTAFPLSYQEHYDTADAIKDIEKIEQAAKDGLAVSLYRPKSMRGHNIRLKVYHAGGPLVLSDILPMLENMGLTVISELPNEITPAHINKAIWVHDFALKLPGDGKDAAAIKALKPVFEEAFRAIWSSETENDRLNNLIVSSNMQWRKISLLRVIIGYMKQMRLSYSSAFVINVFNSYPAIAADLFALFDGRLSPDNKQDDKKLATLRKRIDRSFDDVPVLDHDKVLRIALSVVEAVLRTNYYQRDHKEAHRPCISLKLKSGDIPALPNPKPFVEIFVSSPRLEAVHLRGDMIARGGLRWSDREADFRTEVLGLMKAQMVKNAVIVPVGAKGGFVLKQPPKTGGRDAFMNEGIACYKLFIASLLGITDNRVGDDIIKPERTICHDGDDPYLVVAADKGTATFSDIANKISMDHGFWMGDAFASGGSAGYDHKAMGITAKGAWESVKRHFREMNHDTQSDAFDVTGVGDMGGDVFGNGMLLSPHIRLIGAFNHLHIFCDPDPDPAKTFKERARLFKAVKGWDAYNQKLLSKGGRIFNRNDKELTLTPEIMERFDLKKDVVSPFELMNAILKARTDLLWFGGIGTYIKAVHESNADVGDKANDMIRINADDVRALVIGEGANLGITQDARVACAQKGIRLNADFIDNAGGVDCSDHEVNIKILLNPLMEGKKPALSLKKRNTLLESMTDEVASLVLRNNYQQTQAISLAELSTEDMLNTHAKTIRVLEAENGLDRDLESLPNEAEIKKRSLEGKGLTRPELGTIISWSKIRLYQQILDSNLPEDPALQRWLVHYFPQALQKKYKDGIEAHRLGREIIATQVASSIVNRQGPSFMTIMAERSGLDGADIARATFLTRQSFHLKPLWNGLESLDNQVPARVQLLCACEAGRLSEHAANWFLQHKGIWSDKPLSETADHYQKGIAKLQSEFDSILPKSALSDLKKRVKTLQGHGMSADLAKKVANMRLFSPACDIIRLADLHKADVLDVAAVYYSLGHALPFVWLRDKISKMERQSRWEQDALDGLRDRLYRTQSDICAAILCCDEAKDGKVDARVQKWLGKTGRKKSIQSMTQSIKRAAKTDLAMLVLAEQKLSGLC